METAKLRIVTDTPPPKVVAQGALEAEDPRPMNSDVAGAVPPGRGRHLDVDRILTRSLPKVTETFEKAA